MHVEIQKWGNSGAIRLPAAVMKQVNIALGDQLDLKTEGGRIVLAPAQRVYRLADMVAGITKANRHALADYGAPTGREAW